MEQSTFDIAQFIADLSEIPSSDPLVHLDVSKREVISIKHNEERKWLLTADADWNKVIKTALQNKREADLDSLCLAQGKISWKYKEKPVHTPILLFPVTWKLIKSSMQVELTADPENAFINPFLKNRLLRDFDTDLTEIANSDVLSWMQEFISILQEQGITADSTTTVIGNFHHHRYQILRELELLQQATSRSALVETLLGKECEKDTYQLALIPELLSPADADQLRVFERIATENTVIQGPPGTGKSQVLANLLGKCIAGEGLTLVVSEKRVALEVLVKKLAAAGLDPFTFTVHSQTKPRDFIQQLKSTWTALEEDQQHVPASLMLSEQLKAQLQLTLNKLNLPDLVGGIPFGAFRELVSKIDLQTGIFQSDVPAITEWLAVRAELETIEQQLGSFALFKAYKQPLFANVNFDQLLRKLHSEVRFFLSVFAVTTIGELEQLQASVARCQLVANEAFKQYFELYRQPKELKRFQKMRLRFTALTAKRALLSREIATWKKEPSQSQAASWLHQLGEKQSWFKKRALRKTIAQYLDSSSIDPKLALEHWLEYLSVQHEQLELEHQFAQWGILRPELELESAAYVLQQLQQEDPNELNRITLLTKEERTAVITHAQRLKQLLQDVNRYCYFTAETELSDLFSPTENIAQLLPHIRYIYNLSPSVYRLLSSCKTVKGLHETVLSSNWKLVEARFPELARFDGAVLKSKLEEIIRTEETEFRELTALLWYRRKQRFEEFTALLRTPAARLTTAQKALKTQLKIGKSLLVKEFGKSKNYPTLRELLDSEARIWIELLTPVWLSTPAQVGKTFPMERDLFQLVIFDEASQLPLPNALGTLQRAKRAVVAGDEQQMAPTSYFSGGKSAVDLLHQASYYWSKVPLKHHYRSIHPALIAFSNRHFYNNELVAYPSPSCPFPLHRHFVENGVYDDQTNIREAQAVADFLETISWERTVGITAFSEQQLECIWKACSPVIREKITNGQEENTVFFKALEQVQGDECDVLIISMGYGKNPDGEFHLRFGPLNQSQGYKRLNVLLTRAKEELHFFTSVQAKDLAISSNEAINLLRLFLSQIEQSANEHEHLFPYQLKPSSVSGTTIVLPAIYLLVSAAQELVTFHRVMTARGWQVIYT